MARCLRCHAGNEWIEGHVPDEPSVAEERLSEALKHIEALLEHDRDDCHTGSVANDGCNKPQLLAAARAFLVSTGPRPSALGDFEGKPATPENIAGAIMHIFDEGTEPQK